MKPPPYLVTIRGPVPRDIDQRVSEIHAEAISKRGTVPEPPTGTDAKNPGKVT